MSTLFTYINFLLQSVLVIFLCDQLMTKRWNFILTVNYMSVLLTGIFVNLNYSPDKNNNTLSTILRILMIYVIIMLAFSDGILKKTAVFVLSLLIDLVTETVSVMLAWWIYKLDLPYPFPVEIEPEALSMAKVICLDVMFLLTLAVVLLLKRRNITEKYSRRLLVTVGLFGLAHFTFLVLYYCVARMERYEINDWLQMVFQLMFFSMILFCYFSTLRISEMEKKAAELDIIKTEMERDRSYFELADSRFEEISRIRHDIQNQLATVKLLMETEDGRQDAEDILNSLAEHLDSV